MASYFVNKNPQPNGDHEVHVAGCSYFPAPGNAKYLGDYSNCRPAVQKAKETYPQSNGCAFCSPECHTG